MESFPWIKIFLVDRMEFLDYNTLGFGVWRSLVSRLVRVQEASGSNPDTPTIEKQYRKQLFCGTFSLFMDVF